MPAFLFDLDGTLADSMPYHLRAWVQLCAEYGLRLSDDEVRARIFGVPNETAMRNLFGARPPAGGEVIEARKEALFRALYTPHVAPLPGTRSFLAAAQAREVRLGIATGAGAQNTALMVDALAIRPYFGALVVAGDVARGKPHPEPFLLLAERLGVPPAACLVFEDAPAGLDAALAAGMRAVALSTTHGAAELGAHPAVVRVIADYRALTVDEALRLIA